MDNHAGLEKQSLNKLSVTVQTERIVQWKDGHSFPGGLNHVTRDRGQPGRMARDCTWTKLPYLRIAYTPTSVSSGTAPEPALFMGIINTGYS